MEPEQPDPTPTPAAPEAVVRDLEAAPADFVRDFDAALRALPAAPRDGGAVRLICVRREESVHECPERVRVSEEGVDGDRWSQKADRDPERQVTLMNVQVAAIVAGRAKPLHEPGDNFLVDLDLSIESLPAGTRLRMGTAELEVSAVPHTGCKKFSERFGIEALSWISHESNRHLRLRGINCRVVTAGWVAVGDAIERLH